MLIICIVQDAMVSMYLLTKRKKQIERLIFMQYLVYIHDLRRFNEIVSKLGYTGKALFSFLLPRQLWHKTSKIRIENGLLMDRIMDKSSLGSFSSSLIKFIFDNYGAQRAAQFVDDCQCLANRYMLYQGQIQATSTYAKAAVTSSMVKLLKNTGIPIVSTKLLSSFLLPIKKIRKSQAEGLPWLFRSSCPKSLHVRHAVKIFCSQNIRKLSI